jgi:hypothetical protein
VIINSREMSKFHLYDGKNMIHSMKCVRFVLTRLVGFL